MCICHGQWESVEMCMLLCHLAAEAEFCKDTPVMKPTEVKMALWPLCWYLGILEECS